MGGGEGRKLRLKAAAEAFRRVAEVTTTHETTKTLRSKALSSDPYQT